MRQPGHDAKRRVGGARIGSSGGGMVGAVRHRPIGSQGMQQCQRPEQSVRGGSQRSALPAIRLRLHLSGREAIKTGQSMNGRSAVRGWAQMCPRGPGLERPLSPTRTALSAPAAVTPAVGDAALHQAGCAHREDCCSLLFGVSSNPMDGRSQDSQRLAFATIADHLAAQDEHFADRVARGGYRLDARGGRRLTLEMRPTARCEPPHPERRRPPLIPPRKAPTNPTIPRRAMGWNRSVAIGSRHAASST
ncbi:hypothetical protein SAMN05444276_10883 [Paracoccus sanguinis]|uniref:Uncharacterized protein n=1 Tax=Paracoccus sanguinis TaxID=1545044 RepID=A0A1H3CFT7_9RHOB|nr:hypothetical protein SAMN05444276_10883 [Paracoccus sanguinis]